MTVRAVLLDLDDTLLPEAASVEQAFLATCRRAQARHGLDPAQLHPAVRRCARELWRQHPLWDYCQGMGLSSWEGLSGDFSRGGGGGDANLQALASFAPGYRRAAWDRALRACGVIDPPLADELAAIFPAERLKTYAPYPHARAALEALHARYPLALITNGPADVQRAKLRVTGLAPFFSAVLISCEVGCGKPDPRIFRAALSALAVAPADAVMVGDNPERDIAGAKRLGLRAIWVNPGGRPASACTPALPDACITHIGELPAVLARWR